MRSFAEAGEEPAVAAARFRTQAGPQATITGEAMKAHISATAEDHDLMDLALALAPEHQD